MKKVTERYRITLAFSGPSKLARLCSRIPGKRREKACGKKALKSLGQLCCQCCAQNPAILQKVGQTGHCVTERAREHELSLVEDKGAHLPTDCHACGCEPRFNEMKIPNKKSKNREARELAEAHYIGKSADDCVSVCTTLLTHPLYF